MPFISEAYLDGLSEEKRRHIQRDQVTLGYHPETHDRLTVTAVDRYAGTYVLGVQGVGKSGLLENLIAHDAEGGNAIIVIDPHGDLIAHCLGQLPQHRMIDTYLLDMEDEEYPFGINLFHADKLESSVAKTRTVDRLMHIFEVLWADVLAQQNLPRYMRAATIVFLDNPGATLVDMYRFLLDEAFRSRMLKNVTDTTVRQFWQAQYDDLSSAERNRRVLPLVGRLESLFMGRSLVRNIVGQHSNTINFRHAIEEKQIVLIRLPIKTVKQDAELIGTIIMSQIHAAIFSFANAPEEKRPGVSLYVDEFQHFATSDFSELFTEGRKFKVRLVIAHQYRNQLPNYLQDSTMTARTKVVFQTTPEDAREIAHVFPPQEETVRPEDISANVTEELRLRASDYGPMVQEFVTWYLQPLQKYRRGRGKLEIAHGGFDLLGEFANMAAGGQLDNPMMDDPTDFLNRLLYDVMRSGNPNLPVPWQIPVGFSNSGRGFFAAARGISHDDLTADVLHRIPSYLVVRRADGSLKWGRAPESSKEQLYHFLFHLRMVMQHLAANPVGKKSTASTTVVGQMLTQLPRRAAFVRSGDTVGVMYTHNTPKTAPPSELRTRTLAVQAHTRLAYCHARDEVEAAFTGDQAVQDAVQVAVQVPQGAPINRWEEV